MARAMVHVDAATVLVVADDAPVRPLVVAALGLKDYRTLQAWHHASLHAALAHQPDLIMLDVKAPMLNSIAISQHMRYDPRTAHIPIIGMAGLGERPAGMIADDWLFKPFDLTTLYGLVARLLAIAQPHGDSRVG